MRTARGTRRLRSGRRRLRVDEHAHTCRGNRTVAYVLKTLVVETSSGAHVTTDLRHPSSGKGWTTRYPSVRTWPLPRTGCPLRGSLTAG